MTEEYKLEEKKESKTPKKQREILERAKKLLQTNTVELAKLTVLTQKYLADSLLRFSEETYLLTHGWRKEGPDSWTAPENYTKPHVKISRGHAVNSQKTQ